MRPKECKLELYYPPNISQKADLCGTHDQNSPAVPRRSFIKLVRWGSLILTYNSSLTNCLAYEIRICLGELEI